MVLGSTINWLGLNRELFSALEDTGKRKQRKVSGIGHCVIFKSHSFFDVFTPDYGWGNENEPNSCVRHVF